MSWPLLDGVPTADVERLLDMARKRHFARGEVVFHEGDPADTLHLLRSGRVSVRTRTEYADEAILAVMGPGTIFGELSLLTPGAPRSATVAALEDTETLAVHQLDFARLRREHPGTTEVLIAILADQVRRLSLHLREALYLPADSRVRRRLLEMADQYRDGDEVEVVVPLTQDDLAGLAGASRQLVNRVLREDEARGSLKIGRGKTTIVDPEAIRRYA